MTDTGQQPIKSGGWTIFAHPIFLDQLRPLDAEVRKLRIKDPKGYKGKKAAKRLSAIRKIINQIIPAEPGADAHRQGGTLGTDNKHWFRVKFLQQYRLFYRFNSEARVIILGWVNDEKTLHAYESKSDAYRVFARMLESGHPPGDWDALLSEAKAVDGGLGMSDE